MKRYGVDNATVTSSLFSNNIGTFYFRPLLTLKVKSRNVGNDECLINSVFQFLVFLTRYGRRYTTISTMMLSGVSCGSVAFIPGDTDVPGIAHVILYKN